MDRDTLMGLLDLLADKTLKVDVEGLIYDENNDGYTPDDVEAELASLEESIADLRKVLAWARMAPKFAGEPAKV